MWKIQILLPGRVCENSTGNPSWKLLWLRYYTCRFVGEEICVRVKHYGVQEDLPFTDTLELWLNVLDCSFSIRLDAAISEKSVSFHMTIWNLPVTFTSSLFCSLIPKLSPIHANSHSSLSWQFFTLTCLLLQITSEKQLYNFLVVVNISNTETIIFCPLIFYFPS